uniref:Uncharacterized protein n=1 Tax=Octopus bimaculoides TaxID=37653 RepID=A0A0L8HJB0_OCTBM
MFQNVQYHDQKFNQVIDTSDTDLEELEGQIREVTSSIFQEILVKSVDAIPGRLKKMVVASGVHIEF